jgi:hypothetical protein
MKAPTRYGLMSLIVMLSSLPLGAAAGEQPAADAAANRAKNFILKDRRDGGGRRTAPSPCVDPYRLWRMNHI